MKSPKKIVRYAAGMLLLLPFFLLNSCSDDDDNFEDVVPDFAQAIIRSFEVNGEFAQIEHSSATITMTLPGGTDLSTVNVYLSVP